ncbi:ABC transporter permease [Solitalea lacus]|uniref:ABC transporter permease n=1 Tax=Solitalea lacus TaxID=2911172 RepID=UPI001EDC3676|nr:FtsX-like permease family protein [Solitalea lacus]UKJ06613.1 FtsX-like permease family protein [Solitalea lacus]
MNLIKLSWYNLKANILSTLLNVLLLSFGVGIIALLMLVSDQIGKKLENNAKGVDVVVGAKGSPLQLILSSIYHIDFPTGNIKLSQAQNIMRNPAVKMAVPVGLGDSYEQFRIVGTNAKFAELYELSLASGKPFDGLYEVNIGAIVAKVKGLKIGDTFHGSHGLSEGGEEHHEHNYKVVGIYNQTGSVVDNLVLTSMESIWGMHGEAAHTSHLQGEIGATDQHAQDLDESHLVHDQFHGEAPLDKTPHTHAEIENEPEDNREITALLIKYRSPVSIVTFPRFVNAETNMQAASPAQESARLFSLIGVGIKAIQWFAGLIIIISIFSVFISLYNSLKDRKYDLAIIRTMGAPRSKVFMLIITEGLLLAIIATVIGLLWSHGALEIIGSYQEAEQTKLTGKAFVKDEWKLIIGGLIVGIIAAIIPAIQAYRTDISKTLAEK